jgi:hypothetical protein
MLLGTTTMSSSARDGTGVLAGLGVDKATAEANIAETVAATLAAHQQN